MSNKRYSYNPPLQSTHVPLNIANFCTKKDQPLRSKKKKKVYPLRFGLHFLGTIRDHKDIKIFLNCLGNNLQGTYIKILYPLKLVSTWFGVMETLICVDKDNQWKHDSEFIKINKNMHDTYFIFNFSREIDCELSKICQRPASYAHRRR